MLKKSDNPPPRPPGCASVRDLAGDWWLGYTIARHEKALAWDLIARKVPHYLPMLARETFSGGRKRHGMSLPFPGHIFFRGGEAERVAAVSTNHLSQVIAVPPEHQAKLTEELAAVERVLEVGPGEGLSIEVYEQRVEGRQRRVVTRPLTGVAGVEPPASADPSAPDTVALVLPITMLASGLVVRMPADALEFAD